MASRLEKSLLKHGTFTGQVSQEMIDMAKQMYSSVCVKLKHEEDKDGWLDWIPEVRKQIGNKNL